MIELLTFIGNLNLGTFILLWTSTIFLIIFIALLLFSVLQMKKEATKISNKIREIIALLAEK
jgi:hypothetical protein